MNNQTAVIIITGYPGTGKTTLGQKIAEYFDIPFISKDEIKENLFQTLGWSDVDWSVKLGATSYELMFYFARQLSKAKKPFIMETHFSKASENDFEKLIKEYGVYPIQIICDSDQKTILSRIKQRITGGERHPGHLDHKKYDELKEKIKIDYPPLDIAGKIIKLNTNDFDKIDYPDLFSELSNLIGKTDLLKTATDFVDKSYEQKKPHFQRTLDWVLKLKPDADLSLQIAAYSHDIERAFNKQSGRKRLTYKTKTELTKHQTDSSVIMYDLLCGQNAPDLAAKVKELISKHEIGGTDDQNILKDADSISYLETSALRNLEWLGTVPESEVRQKFDWMYYRITSPEAKKLAKPFYEKAVEALSDKLKELKSKSAKK